MALIIILILVAGAIGLAIMLSDDAPRVNSSGGYQKMNLPADSEVAYIVCTFSMLGKLAEIDGHIAAEEVQKIEEFIDSHLKLNAKTRALALKVFGEATDSPVTFRDYAERFRRAHPDQVQLSDKIIEILVQVSAADGVLSLEEDKLIHTAALLLGLTEAGYERIKREYVPVDAITQ